MRIWRGLVLSMGLVVLQAAAVPVEYIIFTFKNDQPIGSRQVKPVELKNAAIALSSAFKEQTPTYEVLVNVAKGMTAKDRCFNLYSSRVALASIEAGILDASQYAEDFLKNSINSIESVNDQTQVKCEMK